MGCRLRLNVTGGGISVSSVLTAAPMHDSQLAIPSATMTAGVVKNMYGVMDSAYDAEESKTHSEPLSHVPLIEVNPRGPKSRRRSGCATGSGSTGGI